MEQLVKYNTAILAKEKGFNDLCNTVYINENKTAIHFPMNSELGFSSIKEFNDRGLRNSTLKELDTKFKCEVTAPTQFELQTWLRKTFNIYISVNIGEKSDFIVNVKFLTKEFSERIFDTYEEALEAGLYQALNFLK